MAEEKSQRGGARPGAGRKPKALEDDLHERLQKALKKGLKGRNQSHLDAIFDQLVADCTSPSFRVRHASRAMLYERLYGKTAPPAPEDDGELGDGTFIVRVPVRMRADEWQKQVTPPEPSPK